MNIKLLRKLARQPEYQLLYSSAKEMGTLRLFRNSMDLSVIQMLFLHWLSVYSSLYMDEALNKKYISDDVIQDDIRTEAYLLWRREEDKKEAEKSTQTKENNTGVPSVVFTKK